MILVTGASGNVGQEVVRQMAATAHPVRAAYQSSMKASAAPAGVETILLDYNRAETLRAALVGVDRVFLVGPVAPTLVELERNATEAIKRSGVPLVVKLSAMGTRNVTFPRQHQESEDFIRASGIGFTFLRPNGFMQNMVTYNSGTIKEQSAFFGSQGEGRVSHIDIRDIAAVAVKTLTEDGHLGKTYTLTGPEALSNQRIAEILSATLGREIRYVDLTPEQLKKALLDAGMSEWSANALLELDNLYRTSGASEVTGDVTQILGRKPRSYQEFARDYLASFR